MSTDRIAEWDLDTREEDGLIRAISDLEEKHQSLVTLTASVDSWDKIRAMLCALRASNISALLLLKRGQLLLEDQEISAVFNFLREWDQLLLQNILEICEGWIPQAFLPSLHSEAKIELKWFQEWLSASTDSRIHKYPGLPWRSFIRKITQENYQFATRFLELVALPATESNVKAVQDHFKAFLEAKKKVVCVFPKRWAKVN